MLQRRSAQEKVFKRLKFHTVAPVPLHQLVGAGSNRVCGKIMAAVDQRLRYNGVAMAGQVLQHQSVGLGCLHLHGQLVHHVDIDDIPAVQIDFWMLLAPFNGGFDVLGGHGFAVVVFDAAFQLKFPQGVAEVLVTFHQIRLGLQIHIRAE